MLHLLNETGSILIVEYKTCLQLLTLDLPFLALLLKQVTFRTIYGLDTHFAGWVTAILGVGSVMAFLRAEGCGNIRAARPSSGRICLVGDRQSGQAVK